MLIVIYNLLLCFIPLEMHVHLICAIKFNLLTYMRLEIWHKVGLSGD